MSKHQEECLKHIQKTVDFLYAFEQWENTAFVKALSLGIQGKKREARLAGTYDENIRKYLQSAAGDIFCVEIYPSEADAMFPRINNIEEYLTEYRAGLWDMYYKLHDAANMFVAPLCLRKLAKPLYDRADCIMDEIVDLNRKIKRWDDMKKLGTPLHDLYIYETSDHNNHDVAEKKEHKVGYDY